MPSNPYKTSVNKSKSVKRWARAVREVDHLGTVTKSQMLQIHSVVRRHFRVLMCRESESSPIPPSLSQLEKDGLIERFPVGAPIPHGASMPLIDATDFVKVGIHMNFDDSLQVELELKRWGVRRFSFNWETDLDDRVNFLARELFWNSFYRATRARAYKYTISEHLLRRQIVLPVISAHFKRLALMYKEQCQNTEVLDYHYMVAEKKKICKEYQDYLKKSGVEHSYVQIFQPRNYSILGDTFEVKVMAGSHLVDELHIVIPRWWSHKTLSFMAAIEARVHAHVLSRQEFPGTMRPPHRYIKTTSSECSVIPRHLPSDMYSYEFTDALPPADLAELKMKPSLLPDLANMATIFPSTNLPVFQLPWEYSLNEGYSSDDDVSSDEIVDSDTELFTNTMSNDETGVKNVEDRFHTQMTDLRTELKNSITMFSDFKKELQDLMPMRLGELKKAQEDIEQLSAKINSLPGDSDGVEIESGSSESDHDLPPADLEVPTPLDS